MSSLSKHDIVNAIIPHKELSKGLAAAFAPVNIALAKYWGKRNEELHLPITDSLSVAIDAGTHTHVSQTKEHDLVILNNHSVSTESAFYKRLHDFLNLFRPHPSFFFRVETTNTIPTGAGLASSASGFAALILALDQLFDWNLETQHLSILARLGSGSACRSLYPGFVHWQRGNRDDGMDSFATPLPYQWPELRFGICMIDDAQKPICSRRAMKNTVNTSPIYTTWPQQLQTDLRDIQNALRQQDFALFGNTVERNALYMHASMLTASPPICYWQDRSVKIMHTIWQARNEGLALYFTMDAGPNIKFFYLADDHEAVQCRIPHAHFLPLYRK